MEDRISRMAESRCRLSGDELCYRQSFFICLNCRLIRLPPLCPPSAPENPRQTDETETLPSSFQARDWQSHFRKLSQCNKGPDETTRPRRYNRPNQRLPKADGKWIRYRRNVHDRTTPERQSRSEMKIHFAEPPLCGNQSQSGDRVVLLDERRNISLQPDNDLICKYIDVGCDKLKGRQRQITRGQAQNRNFAEQEIQTDDTERNCFLKDGNMVSSAKIQRAQVPKSVGFYVPKTDPEVIASGSRKDRFCRTSPRSRYPIRTHGGRGPVKQSRCRPDPSDPQNRNEQRKEKSYLMVKVNLQPFRRMKFHPNPNTPTGPEPAETTHGAGQGFQTAKKSRMKSFKDKVAQAPTATAHSGTNDLDSVTSAVGDVTSDGPVLAGNREKTEKPTNDSEEKDPRANDDAAQCKETPYIVSQFTKREEEADNGTCVPAGVLQNALEDVSAKLPETQRPDVFSEQESLISEVNHTGETSTERRGEHAERRDLEIRSAAEELGEKKTSPNRESKDIAPSLRGRAPDTSLSMAAAEKDVNISRDTDTDGQSSSMDRNKMAAYSQAGGEGRVNELDRLCGTDNSAAQNTINAIVDKGVNDEEPSTDGPCDHSLNERSMGDAGGAGGHGVPRIEHRVKGRDGVDTLYGDSFPVEQTPRGSSGNKEELEGFDLEVGSNGEALKGYLRDGVRTDQQVGETLGKDGDEPRGSQKLKEVEIGTESRGGRACNGSGSREPLTARANDSPLHTHNNHSSPGPSGNARKKRHSLSENSKVIIVVESRSETIDVQKYLSERSSKHRNWQETNEPDGAPGGTRRKKICLILPEKPDGADTKRANRKIK